MAGLHRSAAGRRLRNILDVPDLLEEAWQFAALQLQREAHLGILVAQSSQFGEYGQQFGEQNHALEVAAVPIEDVHAKRVNIVALNGLDEIGLLEAGPIGKDDDGSEQSVLDVVDGQRVHLATEVQQVLDGVGHAGHDVGVAGVRSIVGEQNGIGGGIVATGHAQHHHFAGAGLQWTKRLKQWRL